MHAGLGAKQAERPRFAPFETEQTETVRLPRCAFLSSVSLDIVHMGRSQAIFSVRSGSIASIALRMRFWSCQNDSPPGGAVVTKSATHSANASVSSRRIASHVRFSQKPKSISRQIGSKTGLIRSRAAISSARSRHRFRSLEMTRSGHSRHASPAMDFKDDFPSNDKSTSVCPMQRRVAKSICGWRMRVSVIVSKGIALPTTNNKRVR